MKPSYPDITGLILAGGASRRMGADKAFLEIEGQPLIARVHAVLAPLFAEVLIAAGSPTPERGPFPARALYDETPGQGPLGGLVAGLKVARTPWVFMVACDMPTLDPRVIAHVSTATAPQIRSPRLVKCPQPRIRAACRSRPPGAVVIPRASARP
jgi:molybdopterin-guanine dinucleotide biosynthesis protein A